MIHMKITHQASADNYHILDESKDELLELCNGIECADEEGQVIDTDIAVKIEVEFEKYIRYGEIIPTE